MLFSGGRVLVAAIGAVVLVIVAVFIVRSVWWDPTSKEEPLTSPTVTTDTATSAPETTTEGNSGGTGDGNSGGNAGGGGEVTSSEDPTGDPEPPFTATTERVQRFLGTVAVDVELPQVEGGNPDVAKVFNDEMQKALQAQADSLTGGTLQDRPGSGVRIGERVLSGLLRTAATDFVTATSIALASTVVIDANSGSLITLSSLFNDLNTGLIRLQEESEQLGPTTSSVGGGFDSSKLAPSEEVFERWTAESDGMRVYFEQGLVAPDSAGIVDLTIPWDKVNDVFKPGVAQIVSS